MAQKYVKNCERYDILKENEKADRINEQKDHAS